MSFDNAKKVVDFCEEAGIHNVILIGGEPSLYKELLDLIRYCNLKNIKPCLVTNGVALENIDYCRALVDAGISHIDISLKGNDRADFERVTGFDKLNSVTTAMHNLSSIGFQYTCSMVITSSNVKEFVRGIEYIFNNGGSFVNLSFGYDFCMDEEKDPNYLTNENPFILIKDFMSQIDQLNTLSDGHWSIECGFPLCVYSDKQIKELGVHLTTGCQLLSGNGIIFDPELNVIPCNVMFKIKMGKLGVDFNNYEEFSHYAEQEYYKNARDFLRSLPSEKCVNCEKQKYCGGGCVNFWTHVSFDDLERFKSKMQTI